MAYELFQLAFIALCFYVPQIIFNMSHAVAPKKEVRHEMPLYIKKYNKSVTKKKKNGTYVQPQKIKVENKFFNDCCQTLISLGMSKKQAFDKTTLMFNNKNYNSIESFIMDAYKL